MSPMADLVQPREGAEEAWGHLKDHLLTSLEAQPPYPQQSCPFLILGAGGISWLAESIRAQNF